MDDSETAFPRAAERITASRATRVPERGFTLIELMIVVAIIGILSAIAYPSYRDHVIRGNLVDATDALSSMQADMERYFQDRRTYAEVSSGSNKFMPPCAPAPAATATATAATVGRTVGNFVLSCASVSASGYTLQAAGNRNSVVERYTFTVNQQNVRTTTSPWGNCASAWILRKGQAC